ncbi:aminotransferase class III-fold pyridoxal phosphate-dependent enzyme [Actinoplanes bogorensis]|uniref:Aminotransferase class III-fold pyridoxal phosphate-dependent enzyme n=1 Tax=Paractinoplanes bogorensis TaxID=1610840 RepID=A0ABS5YXC2_9ACTN|nr:aminotransferase class III-fold pyridoxal phosphate-dependent enzyme [Actinoplanes bogorensis]MBU2668077.1 aminotransferase class III-fold pyridoxal phosphate-dependent enzyme [Actinoplanes bogorensis]
MDNLTVRARAVMPAGNTRSTLFVPPAPPYAVRGSGACVTDDQGHQVIDANNNYTSLIHGHADPRILAAVSPLVNDGTAFGLPTEHEIALAELLQRRFGLEHWRFSNSGSEAVATAIRAARAFTGRPLLVRFAGSYHGTADAVVDVSAPGIPGGVGHDVRVLPQGDRAALDDLMTREGARVAAVLIDLMPNRAGLVPAEPEFVAHLRELTTRHGALLIVDEVITLRLGPGGLHRRYDLRPDLVTTGKVIGGGFPVGAVGGRADVLAVFDPLRDSPVGWGGTFSANPVSMVAGRTALEAFDDAAVDRLNRLGDDLRTALTAAGLDVSGLGSLLRLRTVPDLPRLWWAAYENGVLLGTNGLLALSTPMTTEDLTSIEKAIVAAHRAAS